MLSDVVLVAIVAAVPPTIVSLCGLILGVINRNKIELIHKATNSMKDALVEVTRSDALQEGHTAGVKDEKEAQKAKEV